MVVINRCLTVFSLTLLGLLMSAGLAAGPAVAESRFRMVDPFAHTLVGEIPESAAEFVSHYVVATLDSQGRPMQADTTALAPRDQRLFRLFVPDLTVVQIVWSYNGDQLQSVTWLDARRQRYQWLLHRDDAGAIWSRELRFGRRTILRMNYSEREGQWLTQISEEPERWLEGTISSGQTSMTLREDDFALREFTRTGDGASQVTERLLGDVDRRLYVDARGQLEEEQWLAAGRPFRIWRFAYDANAQLTEFRTGFEGRLRQWTFTRRADGSVAGIQESVEGRLIREEQYDASGLRTRLVEASRLQSAPSRDVAWTYDGSRVATETETFASGKKITRRYDASGQVIELEERDQAGRLIRSQQVASLRNGLPIIEETLYREGQPEVRQLTWQQDPPMVVLTERFAQDGSIAQRFSVDLDQRVSRRDIYADGQLMMRGEGRLGTDLQLLEESFRYAGQEAPFRLDRYDSSGRLIEQEIREQTQVVALWRQSYHRDSSLRTRSLFIDDSERWAEHYNEEGQLERMRTLTHANSAFEETVSWNGSWPASWQHRLDNAVLAEAEFIQGEPQRLTRSFRSRDLSVLWRFDDGLAVRQDIVAGPSDSSWRFRYAYDEAGAIRAMETYTDDGTLVESVLAERSADGTIRRMQRLTESLILEESHFDEDGTLQETTLFDGQSRTERRIFEAMEMPWGSHLPILKSRWIYRFDRPVLKESFDLSEAGIIQARHVDTPAGPWYSESFSSDGVRTQRDIYDGAGGLRQRLFYDSSGQHPARMQRFLPSTGQMVGEGEAPFPIPEAQLGGDRITFHTGFDIQRGVDGLRGSLEAPRDDQTQGHLCAAVRGPGAQISRVSCYQDGLLISRAFFRNDTVVRLEEYDDGMLVSTHSIQRDEQGETITRDVAFPPGFLNHREQRVENEAGESVLQILDAQGTVRREALPFSSDQPGSWRSIRDASGQELWIERRLEARGGSQITLERYTPGATTPFQSETITQSSNGSRSQVERFRFGRPHGFQERFGSDGSMTQWQFFFLGRELAQDSS